MAYEYNESSIPNLGHLKAALTRAHGEVSELAGIVLGTLEDMIIQEDITIAVSAWTTNAEAATSNEGYAYKAEVNVTGLIENADVSVDLTIPSLAIAEKAGLCPTAVVMMGKIRFYAEKIPGSAISGRLNAIQLDE